jgi:hypothetical protein
MSLFRHFGFYEFHMLADAGIVFPHLHFPGRVFAFAVLGLAIEVSGFRIMHFDDDLSRLFSCHDFYPFRDFSLYIIFPIKQDFFPQTKTQTNKNFASARFWVFVIVRGLFGLASLVPIRKIQQ